MITMGLGHTGGDFTRSLSRVGGKTKSDMANREQRVRERAYAIWEHEGRPEGQAERHWRMAEHAIEELQSGKVAIDPAGLPLTEKQTDESFDLGRSPYAPPEPGPT